MTDQLSEQSADVFKCLITAIVDFHPPLDNVGITTNLTMLETWSEYVEARDRLFGETWLMQLWLKWVLPRLWPTKHTKLKDRFETEKAQLQTDFLNAIMNSGGDVSDRDIE